VADLQPFRLYAEIARTILDRCSVLWPVEACGLVYGRDELQSYREVPNALDSESEFSMEPGALLAARQDIENLGMGLQAVYHSHTRSDTTPSNTDVASAAYYPDTVQLIAAVRHDQSRWNPPATIRAYRYRDKQLVPVPLLLPASMVTRKHLSR
jgi:proteasome lid subunit RPN8/RPN11